MSCMRKHSDLSSKVLVFNEAQNQQRASDCMHFLPGGSGASLGPQGGEEDLGVDCCGSNDGRHEGKSRRWVFRGVGLFAADVWRR